MPFEGFVFFPHQLLWKESSGKLYDVKINQSMLEWAALLRFECPTVFGKAGVQVTFSFICLKYGLHSQAFCLTYAQLQELMSWNIFFGFDCPNKSLLCGVFCCNHAY